MENVLTGSGRSGLQARSAAGRGPAIVCCPCLPPRLACPVSTSHDPSSVLATEIVSPDCLCGQGWSPSAASFLVLSLEAAVSHLSRPWSLLTLGAVSAASGAGP